MVVVATSDQTYCGGLSVAGVNASSEVKSTSVTCVPEAVGP